MASSDRILKEPATLCRFGSHCGRGEAEVQDTNSTAFSEHLQGSSPDLVQLHLQSTPHGAPPTWAHEEPRSGAAAIYSDDRESLNYGQRPHRVLASSPDQSSDEQQIVHHTGRPLVVPARNSALTSAQVPSNDKGATGAFRKVERMERDAETLTLSFDEAALAACSAASYSDYIDQMQEQVGKTTLPEFLTAQLLEVKLAGSQKPTAPQCTSTKTLKSPEDCRLSCIVSCQPAINPECE